MSATAHRLHPTSTALLREAEVVLRHDASVTIELDGSGRATARLAVAGGYEPEPGDRVLCLGDAGSLYVIGVLRETRGSRVSVARHPSLAARAEVVGADGSTASVGADGTIRVADGAGRLLFEHAPGRSVVHAPEGDLAFVTGGALHFESKGAVVVRGDAVRLEGRALESAFERILTTAETMESRVGRLVERARESYREVEELAQTRAGRLRLVAKKTLHALGQRTLVKADEDVKLKGEKIYLG